MASVAKASIPFPAPVARARNASPARSSSERPAGEAFADVLDRSVTPRRQKQEVGAPEQNQTVRPKPGVKKRSANPGAKAPANEESSQALAEAPAQSPSEIAAAPDGEVTDVIETDVSNEPAPAEDAASIPVASPAEEALSIPVPALAQEAAALAMADLTACAPDVKVEESPEPKVAEPMAGPKAAVSLTKESSAPIDGRESSAPAKPVASLLPVGKMTPEAARDVIDGAEEEIASPATGAEALSDEAEPKILALHGPRFNGGPRLTTAQVPAEDQAATPVPANASIDIPSSDQPVEDQTSGEQPDRERPSAPPKPVSITEGPEAPLKAEPSVSAAMPMAGTEHEQPASPTPELIHASAPAHPAPHRMAASLVPQAVPLHEPMTPQRFEEMNHPRLISAMRGELMPDGGRMQLRLDPPELGALHVTVTMQDGMMTASFQTTTDDATRLLSHSLGQLKQVLESQGVSVEKLHVQQAPRDPQSGSDNARQERHHADDAASRQGEQHRREMIRRMWRRLGVDVDPLDLVA